MENEYCEFPSCQVEVRTVLDGGPLLIGLLLDVEKKHEVFSICHLGPFPLLSDNQFQYVLFFHGK